ncbi:inward rectifier potassium channel 2-like [Actinia tenebrosa]|uniref:Inward rectifier potassium channel 2-like n=1 Tax=Actinia tenebrosa TaxID=6105 RepID=A0A6P8HML0_ACTTE|nr:inward rectifier potassium channel 2-like [Actinia tenebrosa]
MSSRDNLIEPSAQPVNYATNHDQSLDESQNTRLMEVPPSSPSFETKQDELRLFEPKKRLINKKGRLQAIAQKVPKKAKLYLSDVFTTSIDLKWHWVILLFCLSYILSWFFFGTLWWFIVLGRGKDVCLTEVKSWTSAFLFSIETQQTIGYGYRGITPKCPEGVILLQLQCIIGIFLDAFLLGLTFAKISRPRERAKTVMFSKYAAITKRDNKMCLMFRVGDVRKSQIVEAHIRAQLFRKLTTEEGLTLPYYQQDLRLCYDWRNCDYDDNRNQVFIMLPLTIYHIIDENSPLYDITPEKLRTQEFEIIIVLDGIVEATGMNTQPKTSYLNDEILWGFEFENVLEKSQHTGKKYWIDFSKFDIMRKINIPSSSPRELYEKLWQDDMDINSDYSVSFPGLYI